MSQRPTEELIKVHVTEKQRVTIERSIQHVRENLGTYIREIESLGRTSPTAIDLACTLDDILRELRQAGT